MEQAKYKSFLLKFAYWAAIILIAALFIKYLLGPLTPFLIALAIALPMQALARKITQKLKINKKFLTVLLVILCYVLIAGLLVLAVFGVVSFVADWAAKLPEMFTDTIQPWATEVVNDALNKLERYNPELRATVEEALPGVMSTFSGAVMNFSVTVLGWISAIGAGLPNFFLATVICIIASIFFALDYDGISKAVLGVLPDKAQTIIRTAKRALGVIVGKYLKSYMIILLMTFAQIAVGLLIIGVDNALVIALLVAVFDILPIVGSGLVLAPWAAIKLLQGQIGTGIGLAVLWAVVIIVRQYAEPKIVGKQVGLHPLATLLCLWVGLKLAGGIGMFALPIGLLIIMELKAEGLIFNKGNEIQGGV